MTKTFNKYLWLLAGLFAVIFLFQQIYWSPNFSFLKSKTVIIDETPVLIKEIKSLAQLIAIKSYDEVTMDSVKQKNLPSFPGLRPDLDKLVIIAHGSVYAGIDLKKLNSKDVQFNHDTLTVGLPKSEILNIIVNPSDFETFVEQGSWPEDAVKQLKIRLRNKILARALSNDILNKSDKRCKILMQNFLSSLGYKNILLP